MISISGNNVNADYEKLAYDFNFKDLDGSPLNLSDYKGKVIVAINVASQCGFTNQYEDMQQVWEKYEKKGIIMLGVPSNDFGNQEPGNSEEIKNFCQDNFQLTFDLFSKVSVLGPQKLPLYQYLYDCRLEHQGGGRVRSQIFALVKWVLYRIKRMQVPGKNEAQWNFHKFLVGKNGIPVTSFLSEVAPDSKVLIQQLEEELQK